MEKNNLENEQIENNVDANQNERVSENMVQQTTTDSGNRKKGLIIFIILMILGVAIGVVLFFISNGGNITVTKNENNYTNSVEYKKSEYWISNNSLQPFDLYFLQLENSKENKIYSPLSIKYTLKMLEDGADGESKMQISSVIGEFKANKYTNSENMSFANAIFIKDTVKDIKDSYTNTLMEKYNAEVKIDSFSSPDNVNSWISTKTLGLINNLLTDVSQTEFLLINALAIDMEWEQKFIMRPGDGVAVSYKHEDFYWSGDEDIVSSTFKDSNENVSGMEILASFNNYDIVNILGEENIRQTVKSEFEKYLQENSYVSISDYYEYYEDYNGLSDDQIMEEYLDQYIEEINSNYKQADKTTDFSLYVDDKVKVFAKDLKEYDGKTLQYIGIMPVNEELDSYINNVTTTDINNIIANLKDLKCESFKDGVVTKIKGFIPKFKFEYELKLKDDLEKLGIKNVFEFGKANLINISPDERVYISKAIHKANIEFTQDGIKAAAATVLDGGRGAGEIFDYKYEVPVEEIDLTFDKPYMFIIRDKKTEDLWFVGTVYSPLLYSADTTKGTW